MTDRRTTIKLIMAVAAAAPALPAAATDPSDFQPDPKVAGDVQRYVPVMDGYGPDPNLIKSYEKGELWPLTLSAQQRELATALSDLIIPADAHSPAASAVGAVDFIDEWISAPYPPQRQDRETVLKGFLWLDGEAQRRSGRPFAKLPEGEQRSICDRICDIGRAPAGLQQAARFFATYRNLTVAGFYITAAGRKDLQYVGNVPLTHFDGPPVELLRKLSLA
jgi:hypothetical protein